MNHVTGIINCIHSHVDAELVNGKLQTVYRCLEPNAVRTREVEGFADVLCMNPDIVPCSFYRTQLSLEQWRAHEEG